MFTLSYLLEHDIFLMEKLDNVGREELKCLKCLVLVRPTSANLELLVEELRGPKYSQYHLFFTNFLKNAYLERLAEADEQQLVQSVAEVYADYYALDRNHFSIGLSHPVVGEQINAWSPKALQRTKEGLVAVLLGLRKFPGTIRYDGASLMAGRLANEVKEALKRDVAGCFGDTSGSSKAVLLIVDRRSDLITPLLLQWTYQALLHDLFGITNGFVDTSNYLYGSNESSQLLGKKKKSEHKHVFVPSQDDFYAEAAQQNFGRVSESLQALIRGYQERRKAMADLESLAGMKRFLEDYPKLTRMQGVMAKHVTVGQAIQAKVSEDGLLAVSEAEQGIACDAQLNVRALEEVLANPGVKRPFKFKLALLFALRSSKHHPFNKSFNLLAFFDVLRRQGFSDEDIELVDFALKYAQGDVGASRQAGGKADLNALALSTITREDQNVYTQHVPPLISIVDSLTKGKLPADSYPAIRINPSPSVEAAREIVVFVVGGSTYEEACHLERYCRQLGSGVSVVLGGTTVHNAKSMVTELQAVKKHLTPLSR